MLFKCLFILFQLRIPNYDNLYIDMNGIIYVCARYVNEKHKSLTPEVIDHEERMLIYVCQYINALFRYVRPRKLLFLAVDGVSPLAKLNNQRADLFTKVKAFIA